MSTRLDKLKLVKGQKWERKDDVDNIGVSTYDLIRDAIREDKMELAADLVKYLYFWEIKFVRDACIDLVDGIPAYYLEHFGEEEFVNDYMGVMNDSSAVKAETDEEGKVIEKEPNISNVEWAMDYAARMVRGHRMGREDGWGGFVVEEYADRIEILWDPCYTGGRTRRGDPISGQAAHTQCPYNYKTTKTPHKWTWGKTNVSAYCVHCCLFHELMDTDQSKGGYINSKGGYFQQWNVGYDEDDFKPCRYIAYKNIDWIPEEYYTRIGRVKPPLLTNEPAPDGSKLLKVYHSDDLGSRYINTGRKLWEACVKGDKERALYLVDYFDKETGDWQINYPTRWNWTWIDRTVAKYGYSELYTILRGIPSAMFPPLGTNEKKPSKEELPSAEDRVRKAALWIRSDRSGPDCSSARIEDKGDRYEIYLEPCGSVGRNQMPCEEPDELTKEIRAELKTDMYQREAALTEPPYNFGVSTEAAPILWNKVGVPHYCARCCALIELASIARSGYLEIIVEHSGDAKNPNCKWLVYKELDDIPEEYYTRIGMKKPPVSSK